MEQSVNTTMDLDRGRHGDELEHELLKLVYDATPVMLVANLVNATLIAGVSYQVYPVSAVAAWWLLMCLMVAARGGLWVWYRRAAGPNRRWGRVAIVSAAISGVLWGTSGILFYSPDNEMQTLVLGFVLGGMGAGAVSALTPCLPAFYAYLLPSAIPFCVRLAMEGDGHHLVMAAAALLYIVSLGILGHKANRWLTDSVLRRFANADLVSSLESRVMERTNELKNVNDRLHHDIAERRRAEAALADYGDRQAAIADFGRTALSGIDVGALFAKAVTLVRERLGVSGAAVIENSPENGEKVVRASAGIDPAELVSVPGAALSDQPLRVLQVMTTEPLVDDDPADLPRLREPAGSAEVIISDRERPFGVLLAISAAPREFTVNDMSFLQSIANMLAAAIERKRAEQHIERLALHDPLTGLPNRELFRNHLHQELARVKRTRRTLALLLLDLDHFKDVNDTLGHLIGDRLLEAVAQRLRDCLREIDAPARLGGDEFAVILSDLRSPEEAASVARKIVYRVSEPFVLDGHKTRVGASIGITMSPHDATDVDSLLRNADLALYRAKTEERNTYRFYSADMAVQVEARKALEHDLIDALERDELFLEYQPQFDLASRRLAGAEALVRWRHPTRGLLMPDLFIPVAEMTGLIVPLGRWVLERVATDMRDMRNAGPAPLFIATNISLSQCRHGDLVRTLESIAAREACGFDWLELEVTEHLFLPPSDGIETLRRLRGLGVTISIDDFGTGYSSLGRLLNLPVDKIKIDKSFITDLGRSRDAEMLVRAIVALSKSLGMTVTAEGVENQQQLIFLAAEGCDYAQGFHLGAPLPVHEFAAMVAREFGEAGHALEAGETA